VEYYWIKFLSSTTYLPSNTAQPIQALSALVGFLSIHFYLSELEEKVLYRKWEIGQDPLIGVFATYIS
jgi:hypothetical protein